VVHVSAGRTNRPDRVDQVDVKMKAVIMIIKHFGHLKMGKSSSFVIVFFCIGFLLPDWFLSANKTLPEWLNPMHFFIRQKVAYYSVSTFLRMNHNFGCISFQYSFRLSGCNYSLNQCGSSSHLWFSSREAFFETRFECDTVRLGCFPRLTERFFDNLIP